MAGIYDLYLKNDIMNTCETFFNNYLVEEGFPEEGLTEKEREQVGIQVDYLLDMMTKIHKERGDTSETADIIIDKLIGMCILGKMQEARLCRLLNEFIDREE